MNGIKDILESGRAPGISTGSALMPAAVAALKGLQAVENEPMFKHGPTRGARRVEKYMGFSNSLTRKKWETPARMASIVAISFYSAFLLLGSIRIADAGYITPGEQFFQGQTVNASDLNNAIGNAIIGSGFISSQSINSSPLPSDYILEYSPTLNGMFRFTLSDILNSGQSWTALTLGIPNINTNDLFNFYSQGNGEPMSISYTNLILSISSNLQFQYVNFAPTNQNNTGATNAFILPQWLSFFPGQTNNQPEILAWGTNGVPQQIALSNLIGNSVSTINTDSVAWNFDQMFMPWLIYGTNTVFPYTNAFGYTKPIPITNFTITALSGGTNITSLTDTDTIPINAYQEGANGSGTSSNSSVTLGALFQYLTNKNTLPPYTVAREQFNGFAYSLVVCNCPAAGYLSSSGNFDSIAVTTNQQFNPMIVSNVYTFSLITNGVSMFNLADNAPSLTNTVYYAVPFLFGDQYGALATNVMFLNVYSNYSQAVQNRGFGNGQYASIGNYGTGNSALLVTNLTSFAGDVVPCTTPGAPATLRSGVYLFAFRTNSATSLYYVTGSTVGSDGAVTPHPGGIITMTGLPNPSTNNFQFGTYDAVAGLYENFPITQTLVQPQ